MGVKKAVEIGFWTDDEPLECASVIPEVRNVHTLCFVAPSGKAFNFEAGQFITLEVPVPGGPLYRTYTISSSPTRPRAITITIKAQPDSIGTRWLTENLKPGMKIKATGPAGRFTSSEYPASKHLFISAGSGITPMMSMTSEIFDMGYDCDIVFVNCANRPSEIIFKQRLEYMATRIKGLHLKWVVGEPDPYEPWTGYRGQFNQLMLGLMAPDYLEREVFCCGPEPFMQAVREALAGVGFDMAHYHQESFGAPQASHARDVTAPAPDDDLPQEDVEALVQFAKSDIRQACQETDTVLDVARSAGVAIPSGCTFGVCGTCKVRKTSGDVHMVHNGGISDDEIAQGFILACCSNPRGRVTLDL